jgi:hypothetical protein
MCVRACVRASGCVSLPSLHVPCAILVWGKPGLGPALTPRSPCCHWARLGYFLGSSIPQGPRILCVHIYLCVCVYVCVCVCVCVRVCVCVLSGMGLSRPGACLPGLGGSTLLGSLGQAQQRRPCQSTPAGRCPCTAFWHRQDVLAGPAWPGHARACFIRFDSADPCPCTAFWPMSCVACQHESLPLSSSLALVDSLYRHPYS